MSKSFKDLVAFQLAIELASDIYKVTSTFPADERYGLTSQLRRAAAGVYAQIAEGNGRLSYGEWRQFLSQARGSLFEVEAHLEFTVKQRLLAPGELARLHTKMCRVGGAINGLIRWVQRQGDNKRGAKLRSVARLTTRAHPDQQRPER